ncbi:heme oxygenase [Sphingomonas zeicaulis]|uniref:biliverdin-producing heme oxygenase n=1 Tax=Sphingomonas zeicaulis TaxID=1632740 RepID=UPI003D1CC223
MNEMAAARNRSGHDGGDAAPIACHLHLRQATRADHDAVDAAFGAFGFETADAYRRFLIAHARILPIAERLIDPASLVPGWQPRADRLAADLADLGAAMPAPIDLPPPAGTAERWGALYVIEGSRLGGVMLARSVPEGLPAAYLSAAHPSGSWKHLLATLDAADDGPAWRAAATRGAHAMFGAYARAALMDDLSG